MREEEHENYVLLGVLGFISALIGIAGAWAIFPEKADIVAVFFASLPVVYPLVSSFLRDEAEKSEEGFMVYVEETWMYFAIFTGQVAGFFLAAMMEPSLFELQISVFEPQISEMGITGFAIADVTFASILLNNLFVFSLILVSAALIGSAGAFILAWNGSVLGVFLAVLTSELRGTEVITGAEGVPSPLFYLPHATLEMGGFIVAGITGTIISAALYRRHFSRETWKAIGGMLALGVFLIVAGAYVETA